MQVGEVVPQVLRVWDDIEDLPGTGKSGKGWITENEGIGGSKWFSLHKCKRWRMAFVIAKLEIDVARHMKDTSSTLRCSIAVEEEPSIQRQFDDVLN